MDIGVIAVNQNRREDLQELLESIEVLLGREDCDVLVVDNGSSDDSEEVYDAYEPEGLGVVRLPKNYGAATGRNVAMANVDGDVVIQLDSDTVVPRPERMVERVREKFEARPDLGIAGFELQDYETGQRRDYLFTEYFEEDTSVSTFCAAAVAVRTEAFNRVSGYPDEFFYYKEEDALAWKMIGAGYDVCFTPDLQVLHKGPFPQAHDDFMMYMDARNSIWLTFKHLPTPWNLVKAMKILAILSRTAFEDDVVSAYLKGILGGLVGLPRVLRNRQPLSKNDFDRIRELP